MNFKSALLSASIFCTTISAMPLQASSDFAITPRVEVGPLNYNLEFSGALPVAGGQIVNLSNTFNADVYALRLGLTGSWRNIYVDAYYQQTTEGDDVQTLAQFGYIEKWQGDIEESNYTIGYSFLGGAAVFAGYRDLQLTADGNLGSEYQFEHDGYFMGASYAWPLTDRGALSFTLGYAWLDADLDETLVGIHVPGSGDGDGFKIGVGWRSYINDVVGYSVNADYYEYEYDIENANLGIDAEMTEKQAAIRIGLFYEI